MLQPYRNPNRFLYRSYRWDAAKVKEVLERKRAAGAAPVNVAAEKSRLRRLLELAEAEGDSDAVAGRVPWSREVLHHLLAALVCVRLGCCAALGFAAMC